MCTRDRCSRLRLLCPRIQRTTSRLVLPVTPVYTCLRLANTCLRPLETAPCICLHLLTPAQDIPLHQLTPAQDIPLHLLTPLLGHASCLAFLTFHCQQLGASTGNAIVDQELANLAFTEVLECCLSMANLAVSGVEDSVALYDNVSTSLLQVCRSFLLRRFLMGDR